MKRGSALLAALVLLAALSACGSDEPSALRLYLPAESGEELSLTAIVEEGYFGAATAEQLLNALLTRLELRGDYRCTPEQDALCVDLTADLSAFSPIDRTLLQSCIALTLLQLDGVERVCVIEGGEPFVGTERVYLTEDDMLFSGAEEKPLEMLVELYFPRLGGRGLGVEVRRLTLTGDDDLYTVVTQALLTGPESGDLRSLFPEGLRLLDARAENGICYVNFSAELLEGGGGVAAEQDLLLYSIVDTLGNLDTVSAVQVLVEGEVLKSYGSADTSLPQEPDFALLT